MVVLVVDPAPRGEMICETNEVDDDRVHHHVMPRDDKDKDHRRQCETVVTIAVAVHHPKGDHHGSAICVAPASATLPAPACGIDVQDQRPLAVGHDQLSPRGRSGALPLVREPQWCSHVDDR